MCKILISINPEHVEKIIAKIKRYEYRTKVAKRDIDSIIIYCTYPTKKVLAEVKIKSILEDTPERLWARTKEYSGITKAFFDRYFAGKLPLECGIAQSAEPKSAEPSCNVGDQCIKKIGDDEYCTGKIINDCECQCLI